MGIIANILNAEIDKLIRLKCRINANNVMDALIIAINATTFNITIVVVVS